NWFRDVAADLRVSAGAVAIGGLQLGSTAATLSLRDARLELGLGRTTLGAGTLAGDLAINDAADSAEADFEAQFRATDVALGSVAGLLAFPAGISGTASASFDAASRGASLGALVSNLTGNARLNVADGAVSLFGVEALAA